MTDSQKKILLPNDNLIIDFDGTIVEQAYPEIGNIKGGVREFLDTCRENNIKVYIWSARCNNAKIVNSKYPMYGSTSITYILNFMYKNNLYFTDLLIQEKPLGYHFGKYLIDDMSVDRISVDLFDFRKN